MSTAEERANQREDDIVEEDDTHAQQRRSAYAKGTATRMAKAQLKRELRELPTAEGLFVVADIIEKRGRYEAATPVELIAACYNIGVARAQRIISEANVPHISKLRDIAPVRREAIAFDVRRLAYTRRPTERPRRAPGPGAWRSGDDDG